MAIETLEQIQTALQQQSDSIAALIGLTTCFIILKYVAALLRKNVRAALGWDDVLVLASYCVVLPMCTLGILNAKAYMTFYAAHDKASQVPHYVWILKTSYGISLLYPLASALPKLAICMLYLRIFNVYPLTRRITLGMMALLTANAIAWLVPTIVVCNPISAYWSVEGHKGRCLNYSVFGTWISLPNIVTDIVLLIIPIPILWRTHISLPKKVGLIITFATGSVGIVSACLRLGFYIQRTYVDRPGPKNQTIKSVTLDVIVTFLECGTYLIAACLPSLRILVVRVHKFLSSSVASLLDRKRPRCSCEQNSPPSDEDKHSDKMPVDKVFVKLTGIGNLDTLAREGQAIGVSGVRSGDCERDSMVRNEVEAHEESASICHVCRCVKAY